ncbi:MAG: aspartate aminotransferase family protein [Candidatus Eisenbacteria bacterium]|uniref:Aspartate aminotransferase family protein n=1 Tax=Eiseniibacteriota bacterium TaxID=2212470 RepID=A0A538TH97_UNCEI|nr:MAG: aspartate aminotransferase family protein [Candidatus Eisenbacteria bacterium]
MVAGVASPASPSLRSTLVRAEGIHVWDAGGRRYLDAISGAFCVQLGYSRTDLVRVMAEAASRLPFARPTTFDSEESEGYARELLAAAGPPFSRVLFTSSGSEAVEAALKTAYRYQRAAGYAGRTRVAHLRGHFHGATLAALQVTDYGPRRAPYETVLAGGSPALAEEAGGRPLDEEVGDAAALIAETVPAAGLGAPVPPPGYLARLRGACDAGRALWIADEVLTGFGRVGPLFAWKRLAERPEDQGAVPDIVAFGKGAGAGYAPVGGVLLAHRVASALDSAPDGPFVHAQTYGGNPIACAVGRRVLAALREEKIDARVREKETLLAGALAPLARHPHVREVHGLGFLHGVELQADRSGAPFPRGLAIAERMEAACRERGILVYTGVGSADGARGDFLLIAPPLVSDPHHFAQIAIAITRALDEVMGGFP